MPQCPRSVVLSESTGITPCDIPRHGGGRTPGPSRERGRARRAVAPALPGGACAPHLRRAGQKWHTGAGRVHPVTPPVIESLPFQHPLSPYIPVCPYSPPPPLEGRHEDAPYRPCGPFSRLSWPPGSATPPVRPFSAMRPANRTPHPQDTHRLWTTLWKTRITPPGKCTTHHTAGAKSEMSRSPRYIPLYGSWIPNRRIFLHIV